MREGAVIHEEPQLQTVKSVIPIIITDEDPDDGAYLRGDGFYDNYLKTEEGFTNTKESTMDRLHQMRMSEMLDDLCTEKNEEWLKRKKRYIKCDLLIIDDWLLENAKANEAREILEVIEGRSRTSSTMLCSQFGAGAWHAKLGKGAVADAVIDRLSGSKAIVVCMCEK